MSEPLRFVLTQDHIDLMRAMVVGWEDCEFGAPAIDCKRPYGNSAVEEDICEVLGKRLTDQECQALHKETQTALQVLVQNASIRIGEYVSEPYVRQFTLVALPGYPQ